MNRSAEIQPSTRPARLNRIPFVRRWGRHCEHRWSEPVLLRNATPIRPPSPPGPASNAASARRCTASVSASEPPAAAASLSLRRRLVRWLGEALEKIGTTVTPDGSWLELRHHDGEYVIAADGYDLMTSRQHRSEDAMMSLACPNPSRRCLHPHRRSWDGLHPPRDPRPASPHRLRRRRRTHPRCDRMEPRAPRRARKLAPR